MKKFYLEKFWQTLPKILPKKKKNSVSSFVQARMCTHLSCHLNASLVRVCHVLPPNRGQVMALVLLKNVCHDGRVRELTHDVDCW